MGMPNAYKVANEMINDKMRESDRYDDFMKIKDADVVIVSGCYDHIQNVFKAADMKYGLTPPVGLDKVQINPEQTIFINCPGKITNLGIRKISHFVNEGGFLFTTDWALTNVIEKAFPGYIKYNNKPTRDEVVKVEIVGNDPFLSTLIENRDNPLWWLEGSSYPIEVINHDNVEILVKSSEIRNKYGQSPVFVTFPYGKGKVYHMISHFYLQRSEVRDSRGVKSGSFYASEKLKMNSAKKNKYASMVDSDTNVAEVESAYTSTAIINKILFDKKKSWFKRNG
ncbi:hypothetical protein CL659_06115 [bacterium]|nr:hypothetical protein [bacterium]